jgi:acetyltransferase-like isoleucine patch superfamily enzyme
MLIKNYINKTNLTVSYPDLSTLLLGRNTKILDSEFEGNSDVGDFTCVNRSIINSYSGIGALTYISDTEVGRFAMIGSRVSIGGFEHPTNWLSVAAFQWGQSIENWDVSQNTKKILRSNIKPNYLKTKVGPDCWVGNNSVVLSGVQLGVGCVIGAGSVVTKDVKNYDIVVGNPARVLRKRFDNKTVLELTDSRWWELPLEKLADLDFKNIDESLKKIRDRI